jgi:mutator protein MutT
MDAQISAVEVRIAIAVIEHRGRFLIGRRPSGLPLAGLWEFPGGKIEPGETPQAAAARECLEETGFEVEVGPPYDEVSQRYEHGAVRLCFFACRPIGEVNSVPERFRWVEPRELANYAFPAANARLIERLARSVTPRLPHD